MNEMDVMVGFVWVGLGFVMVCFMVGFVVGWIKDEMFKEEIRKEKDGRIKVLREGKELIEGWDEMDWRVKYGEKVRLDGELFKFGYLFDMREGREGVYNLRGKVDIDKEVWKIMYL